MLFESYALRSASNYFQQKIQKIYDSGTKMVKRLYWSKNAIRGCSIIRWNKLVVVLSCFPEFWTNLRICRSKRDQMLVYFYWIYCKIYQRKNNLAKNIRVEARVSSKCVNWLSYKSYLSHFMAISWRLQVEKGSSIDDFRTRWKRRGKFISMYQ